MLTRCCCASFVLSSGFKAKLSQNHGIETPRWPDSVHTARNGSQHAAPTADSLLPHPMNSAFASWRGCQFLGLPSSPLALPVSTDELGSMARDPGARCMFSRMQSEGLLSKGSVECQSIRKLDQSTTQLDTEMLVPWKSRRDKPPPHQCQEL